MKSFWQKKLAESAQGKKETFLPNMYFNLEVSGNKL
jgi:hypothetical protein